MTSPQQARGQPPFEQAAQDTLRQAQGQPRYAAFVEQPLTEEEIAEAKRIEQAKNWCRLCGHIHALPNTAACPRLASFELDGDGKVRSGTFWPGTKWAKGRAVAIEDVHEEAGDAAQ